MNVINALNVHMYYSSCHTVISAELAIGSGLNLIPI